MARRWTAPVITMLFAVAGCDFPKDADGTLERVQRQGVLRVGFTERPPWTLIENGRPSGIEPRLVRAFASELGARIEWTGGTESSLVESLKARGVDIIIGGHTRETVWDKTVATTKPYFHAAVIIAAPVHAMSPPATKSDIEGKTIAHVALRPDLDAVIAKLGGKPEALQSVRGRTAAVYGFETGSYELVPTNIILAKEDHIILTPPGESGFTFALDRFLSRAGRRIVLAPDHPS